MVFTFLSAFSIVESRTFHTAHGAPRALHPVPPTPLHLRRVPGHGAVVPLRPPGGRRLRLLPERGGGGGGGGAVGTVLRLSYVRGAAAADAVRQSAALAAGGGRECGCVMIDRFDFVKL